MPTKKQIPSRRIAYLALVEQVQPVLEAYRTGGAAAAQIAIYTIDHMPIKKAINTIHRRAFPQGAELTWRETMAKAGLKAGFGRFSRSWLSFLRDFISEFTLNTIAAQITSYTREWVGAQVLQITEDGGSLEDLTRSLLGRFPRMRAERIARTETIRARNAGHLASSSEMPFQSMKVWSSAQQPTRTRGGKPSDKADHIHMDGQKKEMWEPFIDPRSGAELDAPGNLKPDGKGGAADVVNCRCRVLFEPKRDANGQIIMK